jgi:hypothetical protein
MTIEKLPLINQCNDLRGEIEVLKKHTRYLLQHGDLKKDSSYTVLMPEAVENIILAYRHLEDARMRLGKCIQAMDDGVSIYDK